MKSDRLPFFLQHPYDQAAAYFERPSGFRVLLLAVALVFFFVGAKMKGASVFGMLDRWQTLIAGVLAVVAAARTIAQMRATDRFQEERHQQVLALQTRADALKLERVALPFIERLTNNIRQLRPRVRFLQAWRETLVSAFELGQHVDNPRHKLGEELRPIYAGLVELSNSVNSPAWIALEPLLQHKHMAQRENINLMLAMRPKELNDQMVIPLDGEELTVWINENLGDFLVLASNICGAAEVLCSQLAYLEQRYSENQLYWQ